MESVRAASEAWRQQMRLRIDQTVCDRQEELRKIQRSIEQVVTVMTAQRDSVAEKMKEQDAQLLWKGNELLGQLQQVSKMYTPPRPWQNPLRRLCPHPKGSGIHPAPDQTGWPGL